MAMRAERTKAPPPGTAMELLLWQATTMSSDSDELLLG